MCGSFERIPHALRPGSTFHIDPNSTSAWNAVIRGAKKWILARHAHALHCQPSPPRATLPAPRGGAPLPALAPRAPLPAPPPSLHPSPCVYLAPLALTAHFSNAEQPQPLTFFLCPHSAFSAFSAVPTGHAAARRVDPSPPTPTPHALADTCLGQNGVLRSAGLLYSCACNCNCNCNCTCSYMLYARLLVGMPCYAFVCACARVPSLCGAAVHGVIVPLQQGRA